MITVLFGDVFLAVLWGWGRFRFRLIFYIFYGFIRSVYPPPKSIEKTVN